jgi:hypothetical protein
MNRRTFMPLTKQVIPKFECEQAERDFWAEHDSTEYLDWSSAKAHRFADLEPSPQTIAERNEKQRRRSDADK